MFSVIIPVCNSAKYLDSILSSLLNSNLSKPPAELIVVDHGSTDSIRQVLAQYASQGFIRHIKNVRKLSFFNACNLAANKAGYPYLLFLRTDNVYPKDFFCHVLKKIPATSEGIIFKSNQDKGDESLFQFHVKPLNKILSIKTSINLNFSTNQHKEVALLCNKIDYNTSGGFQINNKVIPQVIQSNKNIHCKPSVSIIIPVYNTEKYLQQCVESVLCQSLKNIEILIINDGSSDNSLSIIKDYMKIDDRIVLIHNEFPSGNPGKPRNQALDIAKGKFIGFVDSDDWVDRDMFEKLHKKAARSNSDITFISGFHNHFKNKTELRKYNHSYIQNKLSPLYKYHQSFMIWDKLYKKSFLNDYNIRLGETRAAVDVPFIFKVYYYAQKVSFCEDYYGYHYRRENDSSITVNFRKNSDCDFEIRAYQGVYRWMDDEDIEKWYRSIVDFRKVSSFIYTLKIISFEYFSDFYKQAQHEFNLIENKSIKFFAKLINNQSLYNNFHDIKNLPCSKYYIKLKSITDNSLEQNNRSCSPSSTYCGNDNGIIYFPDWSHRNPYQRLLYTELNNQYGINVVGYNSNFFNNAILKKHKHECKYIHIAWLHSFVDINNDDDIAKFLNTLFYATSVGYRIIWTSHNIVSHESKYVRKEIALRKFVSEFCDYILVHGKFAKDKLLEFSIASNEKLYIVPHGSYVNFYPNTISDNNARKKLGLNDKNFVFLFFGNIRDYKGIDILLNYFNEISSSYPNAKLVIAGRIFDKKIESMISEFILINNNVVFHKDFIDPSHVQYYFRSADIVILPYKKILTSGVAILSLSFRKPVIAPRTGLLPEIISNKQGYLFSNHSELKSLMLKCLILHKTGRWPDVNSSFTFEDKLKTLDWSRIVLQKPFSNIFGSVTHKQDFHLY
jgi:glycosyltransferase involved in cell wall biosynthesis